MVPASVTKLFGGIAFGSGLLALQPFSGALEFSRTPIREGEFWRLWTGQLVHTDMFHLLLNLSAALLIYFAFFATIRATAIARCVSLFCPLISLALLWFYPQIVWYNGLSGLLHALVAYFSLHLAFTDNRTYWVVFFLVWIKVLIETLLAQAGDVSFMGDMRVIVEAHLVGALIGTLAGVAANGWAWFGTLKVRY